jgi:hypothetical protein
MVRHLEGGQGEHFDLCMDKVLKCTDFPVLLMHAWSSLDKRGGARPRETTPARHGPGRLGRLAASGRAFNITLVFNF